MTPTKDNPINMQFITNELQLRSWLEAMNIIYLTANKMLPEIKE